MSPRRSATAAASCRDENGGTGRRSSTARAVERVGRDAEHDLPDVALLVLGEEGSDLGSLADAHRQEPGRKRIERPEMSDLALPERPLDACDDRRRRHPFRLVDEQEPVELTTAVTHRRRHRGRFASASRSSCSRRSAAPIEGSISNRSSGVNRRPRRRPACDCRYVASAGEAGQHARLCRVVPVRRYVDARMLQIGGQLDARDRHHADTRVFHAAQQQLREGRLQQSRRRDRYGVRASAQ